MRPRIVEYLNHAFGTEIFTWLVPVPSVVYALAVLTILVLFVRRSRAAGLSLYHALGAAIWGGIGGFLGARLLYLGLRFDRVVSDPAVLLDPGGSTISWGAYTGGVIGFFLYFNVKRRPSLPYADVAVSTLGLGPFIGRFACLLNGDDYGRLSDAAWAITYPTGSYPFVAQVRQGLIDPSASESLAVHPVQLYLALNGLALFFLFSWLWRHVKLREGVLFLLYWAVYGVMRFALEFFRGDTDRTFVRGLPDAQVLALIVSAVAVLAIAFLLRRSQDGLASLPEREA